MTCAKAPGGREHFRGTDKRPLWPDRGGREVFLSWALLVPILRSLEFTPEAKQREPFRRLQKLEGGLCFHELFVVWRVPCRRS